MASPLLLIAEDDPVLRELYTRKLSRAGYGVITVDNGQTAIEIAQKTPPALMLCDIKMPVLDGMGVLQALPRQSRTFAIMMLSNFNEPERIAHAKELGADDYFVKSEMTIKQLVEKVEYLTEEMK